MEKKDEIYNLKKDIDSRIELMAEKAELQRFER